MESGQRSPAAESQPNITVTPGAPGTPPAIATPIGGSPALLGGGNTPRGMTPASQTPQQISLEPGNRSTDFVMSAGASTGTIGMRPSQSGSLVAGHHGGRRGSDSLLHLPPPPGRSRSWGENSQGGSNPRDSGMAPGLDGNLPQNIPHLYSNDLPRGRSVSEADAMRGEMIDSPPTSPPSSMPPQSDDEFTSFLLRRAAKQLGVEYTPASSTGYRAAMGHHHSVVGAAGAADLMPADSVIHHMSGVAPEDGAVGMGSVLSNYANVTAMGEPPRSRSQSPQPTFGRSKLGGGRHTNRRQESKPQNLGPPGEVPIPVNSTLSDITKMVSIRSKALSPTHISIGFLHTVLAERLLDTGRTAEAEAAFNVALQIYEERCGPMSAEMVPILSRMGVFFSAIGKHVQGKVMFQRSAAICDLLAGGYGDSDDGQQRREQSKEEAQKEGESLRDLLVELRDQREAERQQREALERAGSEEDSRQRRSTSPIQDHHSARNAVASKLVRHFNKVATTAVESVTPPKEKVVMETQTDSGVDIAYVKDMATKLGVGVDDTAAVPPQPVVLSAEQRERIRQPTLRTASDLKRLLEHVNTGALDVARDTKEVIAAVTPRKGSYQPSARALSPRAVAAQRHATELHRTMEAIQHDEKRQPGEFDPESAAEREVARMLMSASKGVGGDVSQVSSIVDSPAPPSRLI